MSVVSVDNQTLADTNRHNKHILDKHYCRHAKQFCIAANEVEVDLARAHAGSYVGRHVGNTFQR
jgi:hypothetical protein